jgi:hypothetical protein
MQEFMCLYILHKIEIVDMYVRLYLEKGCQSTPKLACLHLEWGKIF